MKLILILILPLMLFSMSKLLFSTLTARNERIMKFIGLIAISLGLLVACSSNPNLNREVELNEIGDESTENNVSQEYNDEQVNSSEQNNSEQNNLQGVLPQMEVHFIDVGQADSALIQYDNHNILIDAGDWQGNEVVPYLKSKNVNKLDLVVGSHPHADHIGQMDKVLNSFEVDEVWMSGGIATSQLFEKVLTAIEKSSANYNEPRAGEEYAIGDLIIEVFGPTSITGNLNDDSIVMKLTYGEVSFMFTGDAEVNGEAKVLNGGGNLKSTILKAGHHGSDTSTTQSFLSKVNPEAVIVSVAERSKYNHPNKTVIDRINSSGAALYATKTHGNIIVSTDGKSHKITTQTKGNVTPGDSGETAKPTEGKPKKESQSNNASSSQPVKKKAEETETTGDCVNINTASKDELQKIKHIGEERANLLIEQRENKKFSSVDDLSRIKGIGEARLAEIKEENIACVR